MFALICNLVQLGLGIVIVSNEGIPRLDEISFYLLTCIFLVPVANLFALPKTASKEKGFIFSMLERKTLEEKAKINKLRSELDK